VKPLACRLLGRRDGEEMAILCAQARALITNRADWRADHPEGLPTLDAAAAQRIADNWLPGVAEYNGQIVTAIWLWPAGDVAYVMLWIDDPGQPEDIRRAGALSLLLYLHEQGAARRLARREPPVRFVQSYEPDYVATDTLTGGNVHSLVTRDLEGLEETRLASDEKGMVTKAKHRMEVTPDLLASLAAQLAAIPER
jgi:hypothetical protein